MTDELKELHALYRSELGAVSEALACLGYEKPQGRLQVGLRLTEFLKLVATQSSLPGKRVARVFAAISLLNRASRQPRNVKEEIKYLLEMIKKEANERGFDRVFVMADEAAVLLDELREQPAVEGSPVQGNKLNGATL